MSEWSNWRPMPSPETCREIIAPKDAGIFQLRHIETEEYLCFGISIKCIERLITLYPIPYGLWNRDNEKRMRYVFEHWKTIEYRTIATEKRREALLIQREIKTLYKYKFSK